MDRALQGVVVAAVRQLSTRLEADTPRPFPLEAGTDLRDLVEKMIQRRVVIVDPQEQNNVRDKLMQRMREWKAWDPSEYGGFGAPPVNPPLLHPAGSRVPFEWNGHSWATLGSLRDVDAICEAEITTFYNEPEEEIIS